MSVTDANSTTPGFVAGENQQATCAGFVRSQDSPQPSVSDQVSPAPDPTASDSTCLAEEALVGSRIGDFLVESAIASGGMGTVYKALQLEPVKRQVALKLIRRGINDETTVNRFFAERQMLALLDHPDIARVYDAGTSQSGQPYFTMEFCDGQSIDEYCESRNLGLEDRIRLVVRIARAVQRAHSHGVIHRDLKPGNVLVSDCEGRPNLKVIDFGIAKLVRSDHADSDMGIQFADATQQDVMIGTPAFMSPEQASGVTVDARTDVFSVGAILFKLLTGTPPVPEPDETCDSLTSLILHIQAFEPVPPSKCLAELTRSEATERARSLGLANGGRLSSALRGDLDWIALRAIEPDKLRRYASADDFADDLERYLRHEPVVAAAPSYWYRWKKFYQRKRSAVIAAAIVLSTLLFAASWVGFTKWQEHRQQLAEQFQTSDEATTLLNWAEAALHRAGKGGPSSQEEFVAAQTAVAKVETLLEKHPELAPLHQNLANLRAALHRDREAIALVRKFNAARERATLIDSENLGDAFGKSAGIEALVQAMVSFGVSPRETSSTEAARIFSLCPECVLPEIIEALDFLADESPVGSGIYLHEQQGRILVAEIIPHGAADIAGDLQQGDQLLSVGDMDLVMDVPTHKLRSDTYRLLTQPPGAPIKVAYARGMENRKECTLVSGGELAFWAVKVLDQLDANAWRKKLRAASLNADLAALRELADSTNLVDQPAVSLIQLAGNLFLLERSADSIGILSLAQLQYPQNFWANHYLGTAFATMETPQPLKSVRYLTAAVALRPSSVGARLNLIQAFQLAGDEYSASEQIDVLLDIASGEEPWVQRLRLQRSLASQNAKANVVTRDLATHDKVVQLQSRRIATLSPESSNLEELEWQARQAALGGKRDVAISLIRNARQRFRATPAVRRMQGIVLLDLGDYASARIALSDAARLAPSDAAARFYYGVALQYSGDTSNAIHEYRAALQLRPDYQAVHDFLDPLLDQNHLD